jgi:predicted GIY-YIG superfamily endonuclease
MKLSDMMFDGKPEDKLKAIAWFRQMRRDTIKDRTAFKVEDGKLYHGVTSDVNRTMANASLRREINAGQSFGEIQPVASIDKAVAREYAAKRGISSAEFMRNPEHIKKMIKDRDYSKFLLQDNAHRMLD